MAIIGGTRARAISERNLVNIIPSNTAGIIIDAQTINESTPGTTAGSQLGAAYGSALYVDRAFRGPNYNYSATQNVSAALLGAIVGGMADQRPQARFHTRYTLRTLDGQIRYQDEVKADSFRHSVGICVTLITPRKGRCSSKPQPQATNSYKPCSVK